MWRDVERLVRKEVETSKKEQTRKVNELGPKLDILCQVINKVHAGGGGSGERRATGEEKDGGGKGGSETHRL